MLQSVTTQSKKLTLPKAFGLVCLMHIGLFLSAVPYWKNYIKNDSASSLPSSQKTITSIMLLEIPLKKYPVKFLDDDIIELIKDQIKPQKLKQKQQEKNKQNTAQSVDILGESQKKTYIGMVMAQLSKHKQYPAIERRREREGVVIVYFKVNPDGSVSDLALRKSSPIESFNQEALNTVRKAAPFPIVEANKNGLRLAISIDFKIDDNI